MASTFAGLSLFNSGPHRFALGRVGRLTRAPFTSGLELPYTTNEAKRELTILQTGRLIAASNSALWALIDAITAEAELPRTGTLIDHHGRSFANLTLIAFRPDERIDRGRTFSLAYRCTYIRFGGP